MNGLHARDENSCLSIHNSHRLLPITVATVTATVIVSGRVPIIAARRIIKIVAVAEIVAGMPVVIPDVVPAIVDAAVAATVVVATVVAATANIKAERTSRLGLGNPHVNQPQADHDGKCECDFACGGVKCKGGSNSE